MIYNLKLTELRPGIAVEPYNTLGLEPHSAENDLIYYVVKEDTTGKEVYSGAEVKMNYSGYYSNKRLFDSSVKRGASVTYQIDYGILIEGLDKGILLMREGEKFRFYIPAELAYGSYGAFPIVPPDETLIFDVEVIKVY